MNFSKRKQSSKGAVYVDLSDAPSDHSEGSPFGDNVSTHEENESDSYEGKSCDDGSQAESLEDEDDQSNPTAALMEEDSCCNNQEAHAAILMENREHNVVEYVAGARGLMKESTVNVGPCADNCNKQDIGINDSVKESAAEDSLCENDHNEWGGSVLLIVGGTSFQPHPHETTSGDNGITAAIWVSRGTPLCATCACSLAPNSDKLERVSKADLEMRFRKFITCFNTEDRLSITIDDIASVSDLHLRVEKSLQSSWLHSLNSLKGTMEVASLPCLQMERVPVRNKNWLRSLVLCCIAWRLRK